jgi:hypothetical protein
MRSGRANDAIINFAQGTADENNATAQGTIAYFGMCSVSEADRTIAIHIEGSSLPNWNGTDQKRMSKLWFSWCVTGEDKVARFNLIVAGEAGLHERLFARFAVLEVSETPTARCGVFLCVLDHKLNVRRGAGYERLGLAKDLVVFLRRHVTVMQSGNDSPVWERDLPFSVGLDR